MTKKSITSNRHFLPILIPVICGLIFIVFASLNLTSSIWFDEAYSAYLTRGSFADIWNLTAQDVHPPLFYFLLKIWSSIFGNADFAMRFMSVFFGAICIVLAFQLVRKHFGLKTATFATFLLSISPIFIRYGQEMRMYTLVFAIVLGATYALELLIETGKKRYYILYAVLIVLGMWTHYFTAIAWLAHIVYFKFIRKQKFFKKPVILMYLLAVALYIPWLPSFFNQIDTVQGGFWVKPVTPATPVTYLTETTIFAELENTTGWLAVLVLGVVIFTTICAVKVYQKLKKSEKPSFLLFFSLISLPPLFLILLSLPPLSPMFVPRYLLYSAALTWVFVGIVLSLRFKQITPSIIKTSPNKMKIELSDIFLPATLLALIITSAVVGIVHVENRKPDGFIKPIITELQVIADQSEPIVASDEWIYYDAVFYSTEHHPIYAFADSISHTYGSLEPIHALRYNLIEDKSEFVKTTERFWYITYLDEDTNIYDIKLPDDSLRVMTEITTDHFVALELTKD